MRKIDYLVVHCTATPQSATVEAIKNYWKNVMKWKNPGYHFMIKPDGEAVSLLPITEVSNGVAGFNSRIINISYIGGVEKSLKPVDNRTPEQKDTMRRLLKDLKEMFPNAKIQGHRDFPGVHKDCPSFNAKAEYADL
ncbi:hypothetical protein DYBT9275_02786 [Dyadobacter sp. CECT 9275]|uniref:N-acetylmuramoyl-L-alanine amidase domain-containing protein n=1 Tax=Dyadobacter helix TaxID=2822344 RepID=A0A916JCE1_9BACT|nr:N-acetylmuramoyl-L-alanine amidase [Dyadobacter sp. CECT 9275]CAG5002014.1 hypothetical protein DYBT9275_02786 [Dyadobacter sp. CECT 9275]